MLGQKGSNGSTNYGYFRKHSVDNFTKQLGNHLSMNSMVHEVRHRFHPDEKEEKRDHHIVKGGHRG